MSILKAAMPEPGLSFRVVHREAGLGSLGRQRFTALALWRGGKIAREIKELLPSAVLCESKAAHNGIHYESVLAQAVRAIDPLISVHKKYRPSHFSRDATACSLAFKPRPKSADAELRQ